MAVLPSFAVCPLPNVELKEGRIEEIQRCRNEANLEADLDETRHIGCPGLTRALLVLREDHHRVERKNKGVHEQAVHVVQALTIDEFAAQRPLRVSSWNSSGVAVLAVSTIGNIEESIPAFKIRRLLFVVIVLIECLFVGLRG